MIEIIRLSIGGWFRNVPQITATQNEINWATYAGILRHQEAVANNRKRPDGTQSTYDDDILGAIGEFVVSLALGKPWRGPGRFQADDVEGGFEVRTVSDPSYRLIINHKDPDDKPFILVRPTGNPLIWQVPGWLYGKEAKNPMFKDNPNNTIPAFYVEQGFLNHMCELKVR